MLIKKHSTKDAGTQEALCDRGEDEEGQLMAYLVSDGHLNLGSSNCGSKSPGCNSQGEAMEARTTLKVSR